MNEVEKPFFSNWVDKEVKCYVRTARDYSEDDVSSSIQQWAANPHKLEKRLKVMVRQGLNSKFRAELWKVGSGGVDKLHNNPQYYHEVINEIGIQVPSQLPDCMFNIEQLKPCFYLLNTDGENIVSKILYIMSQIHPDIQFCPLLPPVAAMHLHFMDEDEAFCCISAMLDSNRSFFDQSQRAVAIMAKTFQDCLKMFMKKSYKHLKSFIASTTSTEITKGTVMFPRWISWIFIYLDFWTLVYIVDNFLIQGPKILIRVGLILFSQFSKWLTNKQVKPGELEPLFSQYMSEYSLRGFKLLEAAFKIRGLSKKKLTTLKAKNMGLLKEGILEIPFSLEAVKIPTLYSVQGTDIISDEQWELLSSWLPEVTQIKHSYCLFSTQNDGCSIQTLYRKCENETETLLLVKTSKEELLGAFCSTPWSERREGPRNLSYFGTGETFIFCLHPKTKKFSWTSLENDEVERKDFYMAGDDSCLMIGGGGDNALWIDGELSHGHSGTSQTFCNDPLSSEKDFEVIRVEVLGFKT